MKKSELIKLLEEIGVKYQSNNQGGLMEKVTVVAGGKLLSIMKYDGRYIVEFPLTDNKPMKFESNEALKDFLQGKYATL
jgi:hypothetical protein